VILPAAPGWPAQQEQDAYTWRGDRLAIELSLLARRCHVADVDERVKKGGQLERSLCELWCLGQVQVCDETRAPRPAN